MIAFADNEYLGEPNPEPVGRLPRFHVPPVRKRTLCVGGPWDKEVVVCDAPYLRAPVQRPEPVLWPVDCEIVTSSFEIASYDRHRYIIGGRNRFAYVVDGLHPKRAITPLIISECRNLDGR